MRSPPRLGSGWPRAERSNAAAGALVGSRRPPDRSPPVRGVGRRHRSGRAARIARLSANLVGAAGAAYFAWATLRSFLHTHRFIGAAFLAEQSWIVAAYLVRRPAHAVSRRAGDWLLAFGGTFGGVLLRPDGAHPQWGLTIGLRVQLLGLLMCVLSFIALGRSFGFAAADRGLVRRGPYAVVRHPIYTSYLVLQAGYLIQSISAWNAAVVVFVTGCNAGRAVVEDRVLAAGAHHDAYRIDVRWRMVPGLW